MSAVKAPSVRQSVSQKRSAAISMVEPTTNCERPTLRSLRAERESSVRCIHSRTDIFSTPLSDSTRTKDRVHSHASGRCGGRWRWGYRTPRDYCRRWGGQSAPRPDRRALVPRRAGRRASGAGGPRTRRGRTHHGVRVCLGRGNARIGVSADRAGHGGRLRPRLRRRRPPRRDHALEEQTLGQLHRHRESRCVTRGTARNALAVIGPPADRHVPHLRTN